PRPSGPGAQARLRLCPHDPGAFVETAGATGRGRRCLAPGGPLHPRIRGTPFLPRGGPCRGRANVGGPQAPRTGPAPGGTGRPVAAGRTHLPGLVTGRQKRTGAGSAGLSGVPARRSYLVSFKSYAPAAGLATTSICKVVVRPSENFRSKGADGGVLAPST